MSTLENCVNAIGLSVLLLVSYGIGQADEVTDWNRITLEATLVPPATPAPVSTRSAAIVQAAVVDALNGIDTQYTPIHVSRTGPRNVSKRAAAANEDCAIRDVESVRTIDLDACRPAPVTIAERVAVLRSLPVDGTVSQLTSGERRKLDAVSRVLRAHGRDNVYDVRVIAVPQAWTGLYERAVLLISVRALTLLTSEELQALAAHEIGHEYVWQQYADAKRRKDLKRLRELELICDAIAVRTLAREGVLPHRLQTATEKVSCYNHDRFGVALNEGNYPSIKERRQLIKNMSSLEK